MTGKELARMRHDAGVGIDELADESAIDIGYIVLLERGYLDPKLSSRFMGAIEQRYRRAITKLAKDRIIDD